MAKKIIALVTLFVMIATPVMAIDTGLTRDTTGGATPIVKAKWEANVDKYTDDATTAGAQFLPSGVKDVKKTISLCAIVTDPDGLADIPGTVYGDVFYPQNIALGTSHVSLPGQSGLGCGWLMQEDQLVKLSKADGIDLFCNKVRNLNTNLPTFNTTYNYDEICKADGELQKETAGVFCTTKDLSYEDPAGDYAVWAVAQDKVGLQGTLKNTFTYLPVTAFETDFNKIDYGKVRLATHKIISGDLTWGPTMNAGGASVRNVGNTRLAMRVSQDDMGFGQTNGIWNVKYDARVGSSATFAVYDPNVTTKLDKSLDLSEMNEMDFSIDVTKFPPAHAGDTYSGTLTLSALAEPQFTCAQPTRIDRTQPGFGDGGWAGWSCPAGTTAVGGGIVSSTNPVGPNGLAVPSSTVGGFTYPVFPHYTFPAGETGYVVQDLPDGLGNTISFYVLCLAN